jgi:flagellar basal-body rod protein FlgG
MIDALHIASSGLRAQQEQLDVISNNIANMQTPGFKKTRVAFAEVAAQNGVPSDPSAPTSVGGATKPAGIAVTALSQDFSDGAVRVTGNPFDLAIRGAGLFEVIAANGERAYTRVGQLHLDAEGYLATVSGERLAQGVQVPPDAHNLQIDANGVVRAQVGSDPALTTLGQLELARFAQPEGLRAIGRGNYQATPEAGEVTLARPGENGAGTVLQGYVELANVDMVDEMTALVLAQRAYQLNARILQASDQILETINNLRR